MIRSNSTRMVKILEQLENQKAAMMEFRMRNGNHWARLLAYVTGLINQELLLQNEYLAAENRILRAHLPARLRLSDPERCTLAEIGKRLGRKALEKVACVAKPDSILAWYRRLIAHKFDGSQCRTYPGQSARALPAHGMRRAILPLARLYQLRLRQPLTIPHQNPHRPVRKIPVRKILVVGQIYRYTFDVAVAMPMRAVVID